MKSIASQLLQRLIFLFCPPNRDSAVYRLQLSRTVTTTTIANRIRIYFFKIVHIRYVFLPNFGNHKVPSPIFAHLTLAAALAFSRLHTERARLKWYPLTLWIFDCNKCILHYGILTTFPSKIRHRFDPKVTSEVPHYGDMPLFVYQMDSQASILSYHSPNPHFSPHFSPTPSKTVRKSQNAKKKRTERQTVEQWCQCPPPLVITYSADPFTRRQIVLSLI